MQFDLSTFALEILNFLVLLWILTRFLYRPVQGVIDARREAMRRQEAAVADSRRAADALQTRYEALLKDWDSGREAARQQLQQELGAERSAGLAAIERDLATERERGASRTAAAAALREAELARHATETAYRRVASMLRRLAGPELGARIVDVLLEDLDDLPPAQRQQLAADAAAPLVASAHPLDLAAQRAIAAALANLTGRPLAPKFAVQPDLLAGVRVTLGQWVLKADLADELAFFMERDLHG